MNTVGNMRDEIGQIDNQNKIIEFLISSNPELEEKLIDINMNNRHHRNDRLTPINEDYENDQNSLGSNESMDDDYTDYVIEPKLRKRSNPDDFEDINIELNYLTQQKDETPKLIKWTYSNRNNEVSRQIENSAQEVALTQKLKSMLKENILIDRVFNSIISKMSNNQITSKDDIVERSSSKSNNRISVGTGKANDSLNSNEMGMLNCRLVVFPLNFKCFFSGCFINNDTLMIKQYPLEKKQ